MRECLDLFGVDAKATPDELKAAYRRLVKQWHPDRFAGDARKRADAEARLKTINSAYKTLLAERLRQRHPPARAPWPEPAEPPPPLLLRVVQSELVLTYLPLAVFVTALYSGEYALAAWLFALLSGALVLAWSLLARRVAHEERMRPRQRVAWFLAMIVFSAVAVPSYFATRRKLDG